MRNNDILDAQKSLWRRFIYANICENYISGEIQ